jgi:hypothetical protein
MSEKKSNSILYLFGGLFGASVGLLAAYLLEKSAELEGEENILTSKKISRIGIGTVSLLYKLVGKGKGKGRKHLIS